MTATFSIRSCHLCQLTGTGLGPRARTGDCDSQSHQVVPSIAAPTSPRPVYVPSYSLHITSDVNASSPLSTGTINSPCVSPSVIRYLSSLDTSWTTTGALDTTAAPFSPLVRGKRG